MQRLTTYAWPGNVRELQNVIERALILQDGDRIEGRDLPIQADRHEQNGEASFFDGDWQEAKRRFERAYVRAAIARAGGNISQAARQAGMDRGNFRDKMNQYGITAEDAG